MFECRCLPARAATRRCEHSSEKDGMRTWLGDAELSKVSSTSFTLGPDLKWRGLSTEGRPPPWWATQPSPKTPSRLCLLLGGRSVLARNHLFFFSLDYIGYLSCSIERPGTHLCNGPSNLDVSAVSNARLQQPIHGTVASPVRPFDLPGLVCVCMTLACDAHPRVHRHSLHALPRMRQIKSWHRHTDTEPAGPTAQVHA